MAPPECEDAVDLPVIDLSEIPSPDCRALHTIRAACQNWGFFRVINHGVAEETVERLERAAMEVFALPEEAKQRANFSSHFDGYLPRSAMFPYREGMNFPRLLISDSTRRISEALWPQGNPQFCEAVQEYGSKLDELANTLIKLILASLGLDASKYFNSVFNRCEGTLRMNFYSSAPDGQALALPLMAHTDFSCLTILYQHRVGGLQVRSEEGRWLHVKPLPGSFSVNIGDALKIWSNCRFRSAEHRVVYAGWKSRLSTALFLHFADDVEVSPPTELVDDQHALRYRPFLFREYRQYRLMSILGSESAHKRQLLVESAGSKSRVTALNN